MTDHDHPFDLDEMDRDPTEEELRDLDDHQLADLFRDVARGAGTVDVYDWITREIVRRFDEAEAEGQVWVDAGKLEILAGNAELDLMNDAFEGETAKRFDEAVGHAYEVLRGD